MNKYEKMYYKMKKEIEMEERLFLIDIWAEYVRTHSDKEWSQKQVVLVNKCFKKMQNLKIPREEYLKIKGEEFRGKK